MSSNKMSSNRLQKLKKISNHLQENKCRAAAIFLILLSLIFFLTMLIGGAVGSVDLNTFTFDEPVSKILQRKSIKFTLLGYCIDGVCTKHVSHDFDKAPTSEEIQSGQVQKRALISEIENSKYNKIDVPGDVTNKIGEAAGDAKDAAKNVGEKAGQVAEDAGKKAGEVIDDASKAVVNALLSAFDNFLPKEPTNGKSGWIARPIISAAVFNTLALLSLLIANNENRKYCYPSAFILLLISFILNVVSFFITFSLFSLVFNVIGAFPGGSNKTGSAIHLSAWSVIFLLIAMSLIIVDGSRKKPKNLDNSST